MRIGKLLGVALPMSESLKRVAHGVRSGPETRILTHRDARPGNPSAFPAEHRQCGSRPLPHHGFERDTRHVDELAQLGVT
jgi:hypothetical protein